MITALVAACGGALAGLALADAWAALGTLPARHPAGRAHHRLPAATGRWRGSPAGPLAVAGALVGWSMLGPLGGPIGAAAVIAAAKAATGARTRRAASARERGVGALARSLADTIRAGHSVRGALQACADDRAVPPLLRRELATVDARLRCGTPVVSVLRELSTLGGAQLVLLSAVLALHHERGGRLPQTLDGLADDADRAVRLDEERAAATAQARATVRTVAALPLLALAGAQLVGGDLLGSVAQHPVALALLIVGLLLEVVAVVVASRLVARAA